MTKAEIRKAIKEKFSTIPQAELKTQSLALCKKILNSSDYSSCTTLLAYMPLPDEADIRPVIQDALSKGKKVFLPGITAGTNQMEFYPCSDTNNTQIGSFGIPEPKADSSKSFTKFLEHLAIQLYSPAAHSSSYVEIEEHNDPMEHILILVPGRAFTKSGKRLGRGKGFYDIYFSKLPQIFDIKKSGVCLECQLMADLPATPDDIMMDFVFYDDFDTPLRGTQSPQ